MSAQNDGPECQQPYTFKTMEVPKPNYNIRFHNSDNEEVGVMDFNGPGLQFDGNASESAIVFIMWIDTVFRDRLKEERNKARQELNEDLQKLGKGIAANSEYIQGRWDLIGEFQNTINARMET